MTLGPTFQLQSVEEFVHPPYDAEPTLQQFSPFVLRPTKIYRQSFGESEVRQREAIISNVDGFFTETHRFEVETSEYQLESGANITDHTKFQPYQLRLTGWASNILTYRRDTNTIRQNPRDAWELITEIAENQELLSIETSLKNYENMLIVGGSAPTVNEEAQRLSFTLDFIEVQFANVIVEEYFAPTETDHVNSSYDSLPFMYDIRFGNVERAEEVDPLIAIESALSGAIGKTESILTFPLDDALPIIRRWLDQGIYTPEQIDMLLHFQFGLVEGQGIETINQFIPPPPTPQAIFETIYTPEVMSDTEIDAAFLANLAIAFPDGPETLPPDLQLDEDQLIIYTGNTVEHRLAVARGEGPELFTTDDLSAAQIDALARRNVSLVESGQIIGGEQTNIIAHVPDDGFTVDDIKLENLTDREGLDGLDLTYSELRELTRNFTQTALFNPDLAFSNLDEILEDRVEDEGERARITADARNRLIALQTLDSNFRLGEGAFQDDFVFEAQPKEPGFFENLGTSLAAYVSIMFGGAVFPYQTITGILD